jgi:hypothetical protein
MPLFGTAETEFEAVTRLVAAGRHTLKDRERQTLKSESSS